MAAGGGGGGAGKRSNVGLVDGPNDASKYPKGQDASIPDSGKPNTTETRDLGIGGRFGHGGSHGLDVKSGYGTRYGGGGGAGFGILGGPTKEGDGGVHPMNPNHKPRAAKNFLTEGTGMNSRGVGGYLQFRSRTLRPVFKSIQKYFENFMKIYFENVFKYKSPYNQQRWFRWWRLWIC